MPGLTAYLKAMGDRVRPGQRVSDALSAERINAIMGAIQALARGDNIAAGRGLLKRSYAEGVIITNTGVGGRGSFDPSPFDIAIAGTTMTVRPGTINGLLPSNIFTPVTISLAATYYLKLVCTSSNGQITSAALSAPATQPDAIAPLAGQPPTAFDLLLGVIVNGTAYKIWGDGNIQALPVESFRTQKVSPTAGELPYDVYYTWSFSVL